MKKPAKRKKMTRTTGAKMFATGRKSKIWREGTRFEDTCNGGRNASEEGEYGACYVGRQVDYPHEDKVFSHAGARTGHPVSYGDSDGVYDQYDRNFHGHLSQKILERTKILY